MHTALTGHEPTASARTAPAAVKHPTVLRYVGLLAWITVGGWLYITGDSAGEDITAYPINIWMLAHLAFGFSYWTASHSTLRPQRETVRHFFALVLVACSVCVSYYSSTGLGGVLLMAAAGMIPWLMPAREAAMWVVIGNLAVTTALLFPPIGMPLKAAAMQFLVYAGFSGIMLVGSWVAMEQTSAREMQVRLSNELLATRNLLEQSTRISERTRISRDIHDLLGHRLTALILNVDVAARMADGTTKEHLDRSHALAKLLLSDVRDAVSRLRELGAIDLRDAARQILDQSPSVVSTLNVRAQVPLDDAAVVGTLWCLREVVKVAVAHLKIVDISVEMLHADGLVSVVLSSGSGNVASLLTEGHLTIVEDLLLKQGGAIFADASRSGRLLLKLSRSMSLADV